MAFFRQLRVILWKNIVVYSFKRHYFLTFFTMFIPLVLSAVLVYLRSLGLSDSTQPIVRMNATVYPEFAPSISKSSFPKFVVYAPDTTYVNDIMNAIFNGSKGFPTEAAMDMYIANATLTSDSGTQLAVLFGKAPENGSVPRDLSYTVRFNNTDFNFYTGDRYPQLKTPGPREDFTDLYRQILWGLQDKMFGKHVDLLIKARNLTKKPPKIMMNRFPYPEYNKDSQFVVLSRLIAMFVVYGYLVFSPIYVRRVITEKSSRVRELMRMMGLTDWVYWIGTFASGFLVMAVTSVISLVLFKIEVAPMAAVLLYSDFSLLLFIMLLYATGAILFLLLFTILFNNAVVGVIFSTVGWVLSYSLPTTLLDPLGQDNYMVIGRSVKLATSLFPNCGLYWCYRLISYFEGQGIGASWTNLNNQAVPADNVTLLEIVLVMIGSVFIYGLLLWYLDNVWPYQYGIPKHPLYFLQKSYWYSSTDYDSGSDMEAVDDASPDVFEAPPQNVDTTITLSHVTKRFRGTNKKAVDNLSLKIYDGQITVLLGHNGAGKTTTMNMITGLFPPTEGRVNIKGYNILTQTKKARENFGLCPQHNVLFDEMTVEEHLYFFYSLKSSPEIAWKEHINEILSNLELSDKRRTLAKGLSGGMKRKLSLGNSMIGDSKILILDEPTAGMDPQARRAVWTLLQQLRREKTILLTTHYMEEADALGDRIAFVAGGKLQCCGSPLFLKKKFGTGYRMRIAKAHPCDLEALTQRITGTVVSSHMTSDIGHEVVYNLGFPPASDVIPLLRSLEQDKDSLGIASLGISVTTMEDVFIRVGELADMSLDNGSTASSMNNGDMISVLWKKVEKHCLFLADDAYPRFQRVRGRLPLLLQQTAALFAKRANATRRQYFLPILTILIPIALFIVYALLDIKDAKMSDSSSSRLVYDLGPFAGSTIGFVDTDEPMVRPLTTSYERAMAAQKVDVKENVGDPDEFLLDIARKSLSEYEGKYLVGGSVEGVAKLVAWYNGEPLHLGAMSLNLAHTAALRYVTGEDNAVVSVTNWPLPGKLAYQLFAGVYDQTSRILCSVFVPTALAFLSSSFVLFPTHERVTKAKLLQLMAGVPGVLFWGTTFLWDFLIFAICSTAIMVPLLAINPNGIFLSSAGLAGATYFLLLLYGWAAIPFSYLFSYVKKTPSADYALLTTINVITGVMLSIVISVVFFLGKLKVFGIDEEALAKSMWALRRGAGVLGHLGLSPTSTRSAETSESAPRRPGGHARRTYSSLWRRLLQVYEVCLSTVVRYGTWTLLRAPVGVQLFRVWRREGDGTALYCWDLPVCAAGLF
uniref:Putative retinal-specific rim abc transporter n=1 Tax=Ixodes ricinus TaxID=34613 RepID=V5HCJ7_IXORI